jgi:hypothetical protein
MLGGGGGPPPELQPDELLLALLELWLLFLLVGELSM